ncbi:MAG: hypothetical protein HY235_02240 [Acidobacteria bacterium]|nr:hypothetical protein [Acidobacteriota bacterium]
MSCAPDPSEYVLRVNLKDASDVRRFCEVRVKGKDVYIYQPRKGESVKVSYHESGQKHVKIGQSGPIMPPMHLDPTEAIVTEEKPWSKSFENFANLLPYKGEAANDVFEIELPPLPYVDTITFAQIAIGRSFDPKGGVDQVTLKQEVFPVPHSTDGLQVCVRLLRLQSSSAPSPPGEHPE